MRHLPPRRPGPALAALHAVVALVLGLLGGPVVGPAGAAPATAAGCVPVLPRVMNGDEALRHDAAAPADVVGRVVATGALSGSGPGGDADRGDVVDLLARDDGVRVDPCGGVFVVEPTAGPAQSGPTESGTASDATQLAAGIDPADAFTLHSRPGSQRVIYLDVDGADLTGTAWAANYTSGAGFVAGPFDTDGTAGSFSDAERTTIAGIWAAVAEDYAPFDVDVTTEDPGQAAITRTSSADLRYGTRALITSSALPVSSPCSCGGIAYVGVFDLAGGHAYYQPALVFTAGVGGSAKNIAEATSHEVGHNLGLQHDGTASVGYYTGHGAWAPIMGVGYYKPVSQWSRGEYASANNVQDDLAVIASHGAARVADDHPDVVADAEPLGEGSTSAQVSGLVTDADDVDWFAVAADGPLAVSVTVAGANPDLDVRLLVAESDGTLLADVDPAEAFVSSAVATGLDAAWSGTLPAGSYRIGVRGAASGTPSSGWSTYGSLGAYRLSVSGLAVVPPLTVTTDALPRLPAWTPVSLALSADGGDAPYTWTADGLPVGLELSAEGVLSGTPTTPGTTTVDLTVRDAADRTATRSLPVVVLGSVTVLTTLPQARVGVPYRGYLRAGSAVGRVTWTVTGLPAWARLSRWGAITGTPSGTGAFGLALTATDAAGRVGSASATLTVAAGGSSSRVRGVLGGRPARPPAG